MPVCELTLNRNCIRTSLSSQHIPLSCVSYFDCTSQHVLKFSTAFKHTTQEVIDFYAAQNAIAIPGVPKFDSRRVLDGQRKMIFLKPLPTTSAGRKFELRSKVIGVYDKGKAGSVVENQQDIVDAETGESYARIIGSAFYVGQGNWGGPKGPATENFPPPQGKKPDAIAIHQNNAESALLYRYF
jgi:hypothetical protein